MTHDLRKQFSARCGHVKRKLIRSEPLTGSSLELALNVVEEMTAHEPSLRESITSKLKAGRTLDDYELHLMIDVFLLHARLA